MSPGNDSFVDAVTISGETGSVTGSNFDATAEAGEPALGGDGQSVWWVWTAPKDGALMLYVDDDWVDQFVSVHQGGAVNSLAEAGRGEFRTSVAVYSGQSYRIAVDGTDGGSSFNLEWSMSIPPANDNFANAGSMSGANGQLIGTTAGASVESGEPDSSHFTRSVWWTVTAQQTGVLSVEPSSAFADVYTGPSVNALSPVANDRNHWNEYPVTVGQTYSIRVESQYELDIEIAWSLGDAPANDDFVNAATLAGTSGSVNGTTRKASAEVDEPGLWSPVGLHTTDPTVWYAWTAPEDGTLEVHLTGSGYFEVAGAFTGSTLATLVPLSTSFEGFGGFTKPVVGGQTYYIVAGTDIAADFGLTWQFDATSECAPGGGHSFSDVPEGAWFEDAVVWLVSEGITGGTSATTYSPSGVVTRAQMAVFLYRAAGGPPVAGGHSFTDVPEGAWFEDAVVWLVSEGITGGTSATTYSPSGVVTRAQMAMFLYRNACGS